VGDNVQRFRCYEQTLAGDRIKLQEHVLAITSLGASGKHGGTCGETAFGDIDNDGDIDLVYSGQGSGYLGWFENTTNVEAEVGFTRLFNGKGLTGWEGNTELWAVRNGMLIGRSPGIKKHIPRCTCSRELLPGHRLCTECAAERER
jgi:hypothetical protein